MSERAFVSAFTIIVMCVAALWLAWARDTGNWGYISVYLVGLTLVGLWMDHREKVTRREIEHIDRLVRKIQEQRPATRESQHLDAGVEIPPALPAPYHKPEERH